MILYLALKRNSVIAFDYFTIKFRKWGDAKVSWILHLLKRQISNCTLLETGAGVYHGARHTGISAQGSLTQQA